MASVLLPREIAKRPLIGHDCLVYENFRTAFKISPKADGHKAMCYGSHQAGVILRRIYHEAGQL